MGKTRAELLNCIDLQELQEWRVFWQLENGFGDYKQDYRMGQVCAILANANRDPKKKSTPFQLSDFTLRPVQINQQDNTRAIKAAFEQLAALEPSKKKKGKRDRKK